MVHHFCCTSIIIRWAMDSKSNLSSSSHSYSHLPRHKPESGKGLRSLALTFHSDTNGVVTLKDLVKVVGHIQALHEDARLLVAAQYLSKVDAIVNKPENANRKEVKATKALLEGDLKDSFQELRERAEECSSTLRDWDAADWNVAQTFMGITTSFKNDPDGSLWVKLNGIMKDVQVFDQLATVREVDLFELWMPFCNKSYLLKRLGKVELLSYFNISVPGVSRDCIMHVYACDCVLEENCILIQGQSVEEWEGVDFPETKGWNHARMSVPGFKARIEILTPTSASTSIVANLDPKAPLPQSAINFIMKRVAGMLLYFLVKAAKRISSEKNNPHWHRIREDVEFYRDWLGPRFEYYYEKKGWDFVAPIAFTGSEAGGVMDESPRSMTSRRGFPWRRHSDVSRREFTNGYTGGEREERRRTLTRMLKGVSVGRKRKREPEKIVPRQPQVEDLGIDPRLLEKWRAWSMQKRQTSEKNVHRHGYRPTVMLLFWLCLWWVISSWQGLWVVVHGVTFGVIIEMFLRGLALHSVLLLLGFYSFEEMQNKRTRELGTLSSAMDFYMTYVRKGSVLVSCMVAVWAMLVASWKVLVVDRLWRGALVEECRSWTGMASSAAHNTQVVIIVTVGVFIVLLKRII